MNNSELCHLWANQSRATAKGSNLFFEGATLFSYGYHFKVAKRIMLDGERIALFNPQSYSQSTSKHQSFARRAACHLECAFVDCDLWEGITSKEALESAKVTQEARNEAAVIAAKEAKRESSRLKREREKEQKAALADLPRAIQAWRDGLEPWPRVAPWNLTALRVTSRRGKEEIETSRGAFVPVAAARKAWPHLQSAVANEIANPSAQAWTPFFYFPAYKWGDYEGIALRRIALGSPVELQVGCHNIPWGEVQGVALALGMGVEK